MKIFEIAMELLKVEELLRSSMIAERLKCDCGRLKITPLPPTFQADQQSVLMAKVLLRIVFKR